MVFMRSIRNERIVVIGGGTGSFTVLSGLKRYTPNITALVSMADDGGSTGVLRDELGVLPPGDVRQCLVALSDDVTAHMLRELFNFRFETGSLAGHSFGNLFLSAVEKMTSDFDEAVRLAGELLHITGRVLPITRDNVRLALAWGEKVVRGEGRVDRLDFARYGGRPDRLYLEPQAALNPRAAQAIADADLVVVAPGDIYTSLGPLLVVQGVGEALVSCRARVVYVANLVVNPRQTEGFNLHDHVTELERFAGRQIIDDVLFNVGKPETATFRRYQRAGEVPVIRQSHGTLKEHYRVIEADLLSRLAPKPTAGDRLAGHRSYIRHDPDAVAQAVLGLLPHMSTQASAVR